LDLRDDPLEPRRGFYAELHFEEGGAFAGGEIDYTKATEEARGYVPLGSRIVFATRARFGHIFGENNAFTQRYYGGGAFDHRGFSFQRLSPQIRNDSGDTVSIGGESALLGTIEGRVRVGQLLGRWVTVAAFVDAGDVTGTELPHLDNLNYAVGTGV